MNTSPHNQVNHHARTLYMAIELSSTNWKIGFTDQVARKPRVRNVAVGNVAGLDREIQLAKERFRMPVDTAVVSCYEAGRDGFWIHRYLISMGVDNRIVEPASIQVNRRHRRAKTDRIDVEMILSALMRFCAGDRYACRMIRIPEKDIEDARHLNRELKQLKNERTSHTNRIKGLLATQGRYQIAITAVFPIWLKQAVGGDGRPLSPQLVARITREFERLQLVTEQVRQLQKQQHEMLREARRRIAQNEGIRPQPANGEERIAAIGEHLALLSGIGPVTSWTLAAEVFAWRDIRNRRQLASLVGLIPTPFRSGNEEKEQGISKSGRSDLRVLMIEIAWLWLQHQPLSDLTRWYNKRFASGTVRDRKRGIVALARKLLVALGKYVSQGEIPSGAVFSEKLSTNYLPSLTLKRHRKSPIAA